MATEAEEEVKSDLVRVLLEKGNNVQKEEVSSIFETILVVITSHSTESK